MKVKITKKGHYWPEPLYRFFKKWCRPGRDLSPKVAAGTLLYMALSPNIREKLEELAYTPDIAGVIERLKSQVENSEWEWKAYEILAEISALLASPPQKDRGEHAKSA